MIKRILMIKNLGLFENYRWDQKLGTFGRFNVVYGWNGSGKTTLSKLFAILETGTSQKHAQLSYKVEFEDGPIFTNGQACTEMIRVFNQDYITQNFDVISGKAKPIYILGQENKALADEIKMDKLKLFGNPEEGAIGLSAKLLRAQDSLDAKNNERGKAFSNVATLIAQIGSGQASRRYIKTNAEKDFLEVNKKEILTDDELFSCNQTLKQEEREKILEIAPSFTIDMVVNLVSEASTLLSQTIQIKVIEKLLENPDLNKWVEDGFRLHTITNSDICEFCNQSLPKDRMSDLAHFYNTEDAKLKKEIDLVISKFENLKLKINNLNVYDKQSFYSELRDEYSMYLNEFVREKDSFLASVKEVLRELVEKKQVTTVSKQLKSVINLEPFCLSIDNINTIIRNHNEKSSRFDDAKEEASNRIKKHYLSGIYDEIKAIDSEIEALRKEIGILQNGDPGDPNSIGINGLQQKIQENQNKITAPGLACEEFNKMLETFLGRKELAFETTSEGYVLKRNGVIAENLSEGEKTAIAFVYFITHLKDTDFIENNGIVVIDDPISSLDSNSLFQAFSFLKNAVKDCAQVFILTHNFDFLQLIINWFKQLERHLPKEEKVLYFMVKNYMDSGKRMAKLDKLDSLLINYPSEYQYLVKTLMDYKKDGTIEDVYHLANIARKVLENFLMMIVPSNENIYSKLEKVEFDENKKTAIYSFVNDQSHMTGKGFNPSLVTEAQKVIPFLFEMIKSNLPQHYAILEEKADQGL